MEEKIAIVTDSTCDIQQQKLEKLNIESLPLKVVYKNNQYLDRVDITPSEVYEAMEEEIPTTSMPSPGEIKSLYDNLKEQEFTHIISLHISRGLSATWSNCQMVAEEMEGIEVEVIDSKMLSMGLGRLVLYAQELREKSRDNFARIVEKVKSKRDKIKIYFVVKTLKYLKEGGRIGKVSGTIAEFLNIKPIISIDEEGEYFTAAKVRGRQKSISKMADMIKDKIQQGKEYYLDIMNADAGEEAEKLFDSFQGISGIKEIHVGEISPVMVVHAGPGLLGLALTEID